jgi:hypothetical protein
MVVDTSCLPDPARTSANVLSPGIGIARFVRTVRLGNDPSSAMRRSMRYVCSIEPSPNRMYGGSLPSASASSGITSCRYRRSRNTRSWSTVIFLIWWVALRPSTSGPRVHPLMVLARMTVGAPVCSVAAS